MAEATSSITSRILKTAPINWRDLQFIQNDNFKDLSPDAKHRLKASILSNSFTSPFYIWEDPDGRQWCLDGKHRSILLEELIAEGVNVPYQLPATFIQCENKKDASKLVLLFSSQYARVTQQGLNDFLTLNDLDFSELKETIDLPEFSELRFEQKFSFTDDLTEEDEPVSVGDQDIIVNPGDIYQLGEHTLVCAEFDSAIVNDLLKAQQLARIVLTDPPYNLAVNEFSNKGETEHQDFVMAAGEMTDSQFVGFISGVMNQSRLFTVPGAIHFIFMDWRHHWHMGEASRAVYGSVMPKQLVVWNKTNGANGSFYRAKHELIFIYKSGNDKHFSNLELKDRTRYNVWEYPNSTAWNNPDKEELKNHPTPKPTKMLVDAILDTTQEGDGVIDWFGGSGSTLIASEITSRKAFMTEIEPKFVQSTIMRYIRHCQNNGKVPAVQHLNGKLHLEDFKKFLDQPTSSILARS